jgi:small subunit ribosomal protein S3Ae
MAVQRGIDKWKLKKWFAVRAPKEFNDASVGEMPANDEKALVGRNIVVSLDVLTHNPSHAYTNVTLKVTGVSGEAAQTRLVKMEILSSYIRSFVRRYRSVSSAVIPVSTKDGTGMVVKLIVVTRARTAHTKIVGLRKEMIDFTRGYFSENDMGPAIGAIIDGKFQDALTAKLRHITDLNKIEVRKLEIGG